MRLLKPKPLFPGARVALLSASSPVPPERLEPALQSVRALGLVPVVYDSCRLSTGYLAGDDRQRAADVMDAFADDSIDGILCIRGGYGAARILPLLDFGKIVQKPKYFGGYSDVTALHTVLNGLCGFITYHTPMPSTELYKGLDGYSMDTFRRCLFGGTFGMMENPEGMPMETLRGGACRGTLAGGNLSLIASAVGTPYALNTAGKVLFLEDVDEKPRKIDAMLTQLLNAGALQACAGVVLGAFTNCVDEEAACTFSVNEVLEQHLRPLGIPVLKGLCCGHCMPTMSLPLGAEALLDADGKTLTVID